MSVLLFIGLALKRVPVLSEKKKTQKCLKLLKVSSFPFVCPLSAVHEVKECFRFGLLRERREDEAGA